MQPQTMHENNRAACHDRALLSSAGWHLGQQPLL
jgi:hypothetical protein